EIRLALPIWYHIRKSDARSSANSVAAKCLRDNHGVRTVKDCVNTANRLCRRNDQGSDGDGRHTLNKACRCRDCTTDRDVHHCSDPNRCAKAAKRALEQLLPTWRPGIPDPGDGLTLTKRRLDRNKEARYNRQTITFNPSIKSGPYVASCFRVFTEPSDPNAPLPRRPPKPYQVDEQETEIYTDGSAMSNGASNATAGSGLWFGPDDPRNIAARVPGPIQTNQAGELYAIAVAANAVPPFVPMQIVTD
ncbi:RNase H, partial [Trametes versicolor FP-101664 SS1]|uniref:RNase H n=1 Tax=Trametes versicolor (strain FP-101664) TaxID=717944 RepID=UPI000462207B